MAKNAPHNGTTPPIGEAIDIEGLDPGIKRPVQLLIRAKIPTFESCEGGRGHHFPRPTIRFFGGKEEGFRAYAVLEYNGISVSSIRRYWSIIDGELTGPMWEIELCKKCFDDSPAPKGKVQ